MKCRMSLLIVCVAVAMTGVTTGCTSERDSTTPLVDAGGSGDGGADASDAAEDAGDADIADATDAADTSDAGTPPDVAADSGDRARTLADYRRCQDDSECPVGLGACVKEVQLSRAESDGTDSVRVSDIFEALDDGEGICTQVCTNGEDVCENLSVNGARGDAAPFQCQIIHVGEAPYPRPRPAFPFDDQLNSEALALGAPFAAICRPPFQLDDAVDDGMCAPCGAGEGACAGESLCWDFGAGAVSDGTTAGQCLAPCGDDAACPMGLSCEELTGADGTATQLCMPVSGSCTACVDHDGDGRGTGRCGDAAYPITAYDCDDSDPDAYYDAVDPHHAFPDACDANADLNCNGLSDADEQIGASQFPVDHCTACFDVCEGVVANGQRECADLDDGTGARQPACVARCDVDPDTGEPTHADCDGDTSNGCEVSVENADFFYYRDADDDGRGDAGDVVFVCAGAQPPVGYVGNADDCDDSNSDVYGGAQPAAEWCDALDNDCDGATDEDFSDVGASCSVGIGACESSGVRVCSADGTATVCDAMPGVPQLEQCNGVDDDCNGQVDDQPQDLGASCTVPNVSGVCAAGVYECNGTSGLRCVGPAPTIETCNDLDDDCDGRVDEGVTRSCGPSTEMGMCEYGLQTCSSGAWSTCVGATEPSSETCNGADDDCDGQTDEGVLLTYYRDQDGDNYGTTTQQACSAPPGYVISGGDCPEFSGTRYKPGNGIAYTSSDINPTGVETCDGIDNNCDGDIDEGCPLRMEPGGQITELSRHGGSDTGTSENTYDCPSGKVLVGLEIKTAEPNAGCGEPGAWGIRGICGDLIFDEQRATDPYTYVVQTRNLHWLPEGGSYSGYCNENPPYVGEYAEWCGAGTNVIRGLGGKAWNDWTGRIERLGIKCQTANFDPLQSTPRPTFSSSWHWGTWQPSTNCCDPAAFNGSAPDFDDNCPAGEVAVGYWLRQDTWENRRARAIKLRCQRLDVITK